MTLSPLQRRRPRTVPKQRRLNLSSGTILPANRRSGLLTGVPGRLVGGPTALVKGTPFGGQPRTHCSLPAPASTALVLGMITAPMRCENPGERVRLKRGHSAISISSCNRGEIFAFSAPAGGLLLLGLTIYSLARAGIRSRNLSPFALLASSLRPTQRDGRGLTATAAEASWSGYPGLPDRTFAADRPARLWESTAMWPCRAASGGEPA